MIADRRPEALQDVHAALDALLPSLEFEEVSQLAADLTDLADRPREILKVVSFARTIAEHQVGGRVPAPSVRLVGGGHGILVDVEEGTRLLDGVTEAADSALDHP